MDIIISFFFLIWIKVIQPVCWPWKKETFEKKRPRNKIFSLGTKPNEHNPTDLRQAEVLPLCQDRSSVPVSEEVTPKRNCLGRKYRSAPFPINSSPTGLILHFSREELQRQGWLWASGHRNRSSPSQCQAMEQLLQSQAEKGLWGAGICRYKDKLLERLSPCHPIALLCSALITLVIILSTLSNCHYPLKLWRGELHTGSLPAAVTEAPKPSKRTSLLLLKFSFTFILEFH